METLRYPTLAAWAKDTCDAIREKDGTSGLIDHQDVPDRIRSIPVGGGVDVSGVTAEPSDVSASVRYVGLDGELKYGTMPEIPDDTTVLDGTATETVIDAGRHSGAGVVKIVPEEDGNRFTPTKAGGIYNAPAGRVFTRVVLDPIPDIYVDVSGANASPYQVAGGIKFIGAAGKVESGTAETFEGMQGSVVTSNGQISIDGGFHDGTSYIYVNVPQQITSGESSVGCTAEAEDVRSGKTFRSGGYQKRGTMQTVTLPKINMSLDTASLPGYLAVNAKTNATTAGYISAGQTAENSAYIKKYSGATIITPGAAAQTLKTADCYVAADIVIEAASSGVKIERTHISVAVDAPESEKAVITIPLKNISSVSVFSVVLSQDRHDASGEDRDINSVVGDFDGGTACLISEKQFYAYTSYTVAAVVRSGNLLVGSTRSDEVFNGEYDCFIIGR